MTQPRQPSQTAVFFGWLLMAVGGLIALTAGACSLLFLVSMGTAGSWDGLSGLLLLMLIFGGVPILIGVGLIYAGRRISRPRITKPD